MKTSRIKNFSQLRWFVVKLSNHKWSSLDEPLQIIKRELKSMCNLALIDEDYTEFQAIFCGETGRCTIKMGQADNFFREVDDSLLVFEWYRFDSGRYEINAYLS